jgi:hypothetical protein
MKREDDEKLWDLLGRSAEPKISPFFARNVLREVRESETRSPMRVWLRWLVPAAGTAVAVIAALLLRVQIPAQHASEAQPDTLALIEAQDSDLMADLDDLVGPEDNSWDDSVLL